MEIREAEIIKKIWGREVQIINLPEKGYCGKLLQLDEGYRCSIHKHEKDETFYILRGRVYLELERDNKKMEDAILVPGDIVNIFDNIWHRFSGLEKSVIIEFSTPDVESERRVDSMAIPDYEEWKKDILNKFGLDE